MPNQVLRTTVLLCLAKSVRAANDAAPRGWGLTLLAKARMIRLNVGGGEVFLIAPQEESLLFVDRTALRAVPPWRVGADGYKFVSASIGFCVPAEELVQTYDSLGDAHQALIRKAALYRPDGYLWKRSHSLGLIAYMRYLLDADVPNPGYTKVGEDLGPGAPTTSQPEAGFEDSELAAFEGEMRLHFVRHRSREARLRDAKIKEALARNGGRLVCEVPGCRFDFKATYGRLGEGYAHVHHLKPLSTRASVTETQFSELAVVCANCHAMAHRGGGCVALADLIEFSRRTPP